MEDPKKVTTYVIKLSSEGLYSMPLAIKQGCIEGGFLGFQETPFDYKTLLQ